MLYAIIQYTSAVVLYSIAENISDNQFLFTDLTVLFPMCIFQCLTKASETLSKQLPPSSLLKWPILVSTVA